MNLSILRNSILTIKQWFFGSPPEVSRVVEGMIDLLRTLPRDMAIDIERSSDGTPLLVFIQYAGKRKWIDGNLQAVRIRLTANQMWLDMPAQEKVELNWLEAELLQDAVNAWLHSKD